MSFDRPEIYSAPVLQGESPSDDNNTEIIKSFKNFILDFRIDSTFHYRDQIRNNLLVRRFYLNLDLEHLITYNDDIFKKLNDNPNDIIPLFEIAITDLAKRIAILNNTNNDNIDSIDQNDIPNFQLILNSNSNQTSIRNLNSANINKFIKLSGIILSSSILSSKPTYLSLICRSCKHTTSITVNSFYSNSNNNNSLPSRCLSTNEDTNSNNDCGKDPYLIIHENSQFIDQQFLKLQELPELVPIGELPRHILMSSDRFLTNKCVPGMRVTIFGIYSIYQSKVNNSTISNSNNSKPIAIRNPYIKILGIKTDTTLFSSTLQSQSLLSTTSIDNENEILKLSKNPNIYEILTNSIAPSIFGNTDIKKAILCLLMGGSKNFLPDGMRLRGDINVLLLGDPGTAKSQLLKFVEKVSPISVYTSGKGSSAAGLTASIQRDSQTHEFYLEGGAMVLADGGVVCIDEFDKMREDDRVAIHEAMEQQTISIAKAGITTVLNSRTSVLAAANPIFGRYDDLKSPGENIDFQTTILSRFDMIFIVKDLHNEERDISIANHVINIHTGQASKIDSQNESSNKEISIETFKNYITYCKRHCAPRLSVEASKSLSSHFINIRKQLLISELQSTARSSIPITIRQLEAIIRITESLAKLELSPVATEKHVAEAIRLFQASTMDAASQDPTGGLQMNNSSQLFSEIRQIDQELKRRLPIGWSTSYQTLKTEFVDSKKFSQIALDKSLYALEKHGTIQRRFHGQNVYRVSA